jgi:zinc transport system permease protein
MLDMFEYQFIQNAFIAGILVSMTTGIIGSLVVTNRIVFLAGGIAHTAYGGIGLAIYFGLSIFFGATVFAVAAAILLAYLTYENKERSDTIIGLIWALGMAIGVILVDLTPGYNVDLMSYLFGSILAVSSADTLYMLFVLLLVVGSIFLFYKQFLAISYDSFFASLQGVNVKFFYAFLLVLSALSIVISIRVVGLILVIALLTIPVYIAERLSSSLLSMMVISSLISTFFTTLGLFISYTYDLTSGATIIIVASLGLLAFNGLAKVYSYIK